MLANAVFKTNIAFHSLKRMANPPAFQPTGAPMGFPRLMGGTHQVTKLQGGSPKGAGRRRCSRALFQGAALGFS